VSKKDTRQKVRDSYPDEACPDCDTPIPAKAVDGDQCKNCAHVFWVEKKTVDVIDGQQMFFPGMEPGREK
jgi:methionyl-tRNA synthetase